MYKTHKNQNLGDPVSFGGANLEVPPLFSGTKIRCRLAEQIVNMKLKIPIAFPANPYNNT
jgi:hypothetical protein